MKLRRLSLLAGMAVLIAVLVSGFFTTGLSGSMAGTKAVAKATATPPPFPDAYKMNPTDKSAPVAGVVTTGPNGISHPCSSLMVTNPPFSGLSPIAIAYPRTTCTGIVNMGDVATWQNNGHDYVGLSGFGGRMYFIYNVDDPYNPVLLKEETFPSGGTASLSIFDWKQNGNQYMSVSMRGTGTGCGWFAYNVNDPANPVQVASVRNSPDWCTVHEHFVSLDANGNADYAWFTMSGESGSEGKIIAMDIRDLSNIHEVNRWDRDGDTGYFIHDSNVVRGKLYAAHWDGGMNIFDKAAFVSGATPVPLNSVGSIQPSGFRIHHVVPTTDDKYVLIQDEFINSPTLGKIKMYDIQNIASPQFVTEITGGDAIANSQQAHNMIIKPLSPGVDLLFNAWYKAGIRGFKIDTTQSTPTITQVFRQQLAADQSAGFGNVWGVDYLPCTLRGLQRTCMYAGDMRFGLIVNAVNTDTFQPDPSLDPYAPDAPVITSPANGQVIDVCSINITGTASDYWSGPNRVEVSTDNGGTWHLATGTTSWTYNWTNPSPGAHSLLARAYDVADNVMTSTVSINVTVSASCPLTTPTALPTSTFTPVVPTFTPTSTSTSVPTHTSTSTATATATNTIEPSATGTSAVPSVTPTACTIEFADVLPGSTFYEPIHCIACRGIMSGYPCGGEGEPCNSNEDPYFRPGANITRGQIAKVVALSAGYNDEITEQTFQDVAPGSTFFTWIGQLELHDVISGYACGGTGEPCVAPGNMPYFRPNATATRGQLTKVIVISSGLPIDITGGPHFTDVAVGSTFYDYIETLFNAGAINGYPDNTFRPNNQVTRAQAAKIIANVFFPGCVTP